MYINQIEGKGGTKAKMVADSIANNSRLCTVECTYPRYIHSEVMTHRMFSRNASSSRAIPVSKTLQELKDNPAIPIHWGQNKPGMQADEELENPLPAIAQWKFTSYDVYKRVECLHKLGVHKQVANRLLEPFQFIRVIITATEWENFFNLRLHPAAQPEIQELARCIKEAMDKSEPTELEEDGWHLPYVLDKEWNDESNSLEDLQAFSVARCARVSYMNHDKSNPDPIKDRKLHDDLLKMGHMSPFEHLATPIMGVEDSFGFESHEWWREIGVTHQDWNGNLWSGNFKGWKQYRQMLK